MKNCFKKVMAAVMSLAVVGGVVSAVSFCPDMSSVVYAASEVTEGALTYWLCSDYAVVSRCESDAESVEILSEVEGVPVTSIGYDAFFNCTNLTEITIPDSVINIGHSAFYGCTSLTEITIPDSVTSIENSAFYGCTNLTEITIPDSVTSIGLFAFYECTSLTEITIPNSVTSIGNEAFEYCTSLTGITIPDSVISIGIGAFTYCENLTEIKVSENNSKYCGITGALFNKDKTELHTYPCGKTDEKYVIPESVTSIGDGAFFDCKNLIEITIPDSVTSIGYRAFEYCTSLTEITIPNSVTNIGYWAFAYCENLTEIIIPDSVTSIEMWAFNECENLTIYGYTGSAAEKYAVENEFTFIALDAEKTDGDLNGDGEVSAADAVILQKYIIGSAKLPSNVNADLNGDGKVNALDMVQMRKMLLG